MIPALPIPSPVSTVSPARSLAFANSLITWISKVSWRLWPGSLSSWSVLRSSMSLSTFLSIRFMTRLISFISLSSMYSSSREYVKPFMERYSLMSFVTELRKSWPSSVP
ncbi:hypothetical protein ES707_15698 [subsurface metagenome]